MVGPLWSFNNRLLEDQKWFYQNQEKSFPHYNWKPDKTTVAKIVLIINISRYYITSLRKITTLNCSIKVRIEANILLNDSYVEQFLVLILRKESWLTGNAEK